MGKTTGTRRKKDQSTPDILNDPKFRAQIARMHERTTREMIAASEARLAKTSRDAPALLAEAVYLEERQTAHIRTIDKKFALASPFDAALSAYRQVAPLKRAAGSEERDPDWNAAHSKLWSFSLHGFDHWLKDNESFWRAADLRREAYGDRDYPVLACKRCYRLTGWVSEDTAVWDADDGSHVGHCDYCLWTERVVRMGRDGGLSDQAWAKVNTAYFSLGGRYDAAVKAEYRGVKRGPGRAPLIGWFGRRRRYELARARAWGRVVHDLLTDWGPATPEDGYTLWIPERFEALSVDGQMLLVHFWASSYRWEQGRFKRLGAKLNQDVFTMPAVFPATIAPQALAVAWHDFRIEVAYRNRTEWQKRVTQAAQEELKTSAALAHHELLEGARGTAALLEP
jgi:hypothetical protein